MGLIPKVLILALILFPAYSCNTNPYIESLSPEIEGEIFDLDNRLILNKDGLPTSVNLGKTEFTIIDFWFDECPPCIKEMKQFPSLLTKHKGKFQIISLSVNSYDHWLQVITGKRKSFTDHVSLGWHHFVMKSELDPKLKNEISADVLDYLQKKYQTNKFPLYLILNKEGKIVATPESAVNYINENL